MTDLHKAAAENDVATIRELIAGGADVNQADEDGLTPLFHAARCARLEVRPETPVSWGLGAALGRRHGGGSARAGIPSRPALMAPTAPTGCLGAPNAGSIVAEYV